MSDAETSAYLLIAGGLTWVLVGIVGLVRRRRGREGNDLEQTLEDRGRAEGEEVDASEECLGELVDLLNSDHPLMRPHVDSIVDPYLLKVGDDNAQMLKSGENWQRRFSTAQSRRSAAPGYTPGLIREAGLRLEKDRLPPRRSRGVAAKRGSPQAASSASSGPSGSLRTVAHRHLKTESSAQFHKLRHLSCKVGDNSCVSGDGFN